MVPSLEDIVKVIDDTQADLIALQEVDVNCPRTDRINQVEELGRRLGMTPHFFSLVDWAQFQHPRENEGLYGLGFLSRMNLRLLNFAHIHLPLMSPLSEPRGVFQLQIDWQGKPLSILNTHLSVQRRENLLQIEAVRELVQQVCSEQGECILMGDFNSRGRTRAMQRLRSVMQECVPTGSPRFTFPSRFPMLQLDRIFTSGGLASYPSRVLASPIARKASDHLPIQVELKF
jgi:endonuclease/exonuclease/phosphatase family metal-dependent hydrolase